VALPSYITAGVSQTFDVTDEDGRLYATQRRLVRAGFWAWILMFVLGALWIAEGILLGPAAVAVVGVAMVVLGVAIYPLTSRKYYRRLTRVTVGPDRLSLVLSGKTVREYEWQRPGLQLAVFDFRWSTRPINAVPCALSIGRSIYGGISQEAYQALRNQAMRSGLPSVELTIDGRTAGALIGRWPERAVPKAFVATRPPA
jgi:hypothetical protein